MISASQIRAARALLDFSQSELAARAGVSANTVSNIEKGETQPAADTVRRLELCFEAAGIEFLPQDGVRRAPSGIRTYTGRDGFIDFIWDVYETVKEHGGEVCVSNVDESLFDPWIPKDIDAEYLTFRAIIRLIN